MGIYNFISIPRNTTLSTSRNIYILGLYIIFIEVIKICQKNKIMKS